MSKLTRNVLFGDELHAKITTGLEKVYNVAKNSYGPNAGNAIIEYPYGDPEISRDGVNNIRKLKFDDPVENAVAAIVAQASKRNDQSVGDGTTGAAILASPLYLEGRRRVVAGENQMVVSRQIIDAANKAVEAIDAIKVPLTDDMLKDVATTSAGDEQLGQLIADVIGSVGADGGVTIEDFAGRGIYPEIVEGFYFRKGLISAYLAKDPANVESKHYNVPIVVLDKNLSDQREAQEILSGIPAQFKELVMIGTVSGDALAFLVQQRLSNERIISIVEAPFESRSFFLEDLALLTGATVVTEGFNTYDFTKDMLGFAEKVVITTTSTSIIGADTEEEVVGDRIVELQKQLEESTHPADIEMIRKRLGWLRGKVAIIRVGGASEVEQREVKLRVVDAVAASQAALKDGVVPGGGTTLARLDVGFKTAFETPFKQLAANSGVNAELLLAKVQQAKPGYGFNLRDITDEPIDLIKAGVVDPAMVVKEVITNAASVASKLLTTSSGIMLANRDEKND